MGRQRTIVIDATVGSIGASRRPENRWGGSWPLRRGRQHEQLTFSTPLRAAGAAVRSRARRWLDLAWLLPVVISLQRFSSCVLMAIARQSVEG